VNADQFAPWPEPHHVRDLRTDLDAATARLKSIAALCAKYRGKDGRIPCGAVEALLKGTP
jgi:hypothetical protein